MSTSWSACGKHVSSLLAKPGTYGGLTRLLYTRAQSTPLNQRWRLTSSAPSLKQPKRLLLSAVSSFLTRSLA